MSTTQVRILEQAARVDALRPIRSPNSLTSHTTRGVIRRVKASQTVRTTAPQSTGKPRWG